MRILCLDLLGERPFLRLPGVFLLQLPKINKSRIINLFFFFDPVVYLIGCGIVFRRNQKVKLLPVQISLNGIPRLAESIRKLCDLIPELLDLFFQSLLFFCKIRSVILLLQVFDLFI